jgi:cell shape-determining protein MreD
MKERLLLLANVALFAFATLLLASIQTSLWFQIFGSFRGPALWIPVLIYIALFRSTLEAIFFSYLIGFALSTMTAMPEGILITICLGLTLATQLFKRRIFWSSSSYYMMVCGLAALIFHLLHWGVSYVLGDHPVTSPQVMDWLIEALLTPLAAPPLFPVFRWFDRITDREPSTEYSSQVS